MVLTQLALVYTARAGLDCAVVEELLLEWANSFVGGLPAVRALAARLLLDSWITAVLGLSLEFTLEVVAFAGVFFVVVEVLAGVESIAGFGSLAGELPGALEARALVAIEDLAVLETLAADLGAVKDWSLSLPVALLVRRSTFVNAHVEILTAGSRGPGGACFLAVGSKTVTVCQMKHYPNAYSHCELSGSVD
ncbi:hypothetical protein ON010_g135 [Phytophthora cinnamomi]|nr:hypothetical protein ON010_g135 [Phytophthora cinnamomi]